MFYRNPIPLIIKKNLELNCFLQQLYYKNLLNILNIKNFNS